MQGVIAVGVSNSEVVHDQGEMDIPGGVAPQARGERARVVPMWEEQLLEVIIGNAASLGKAVHTLADFHIDMAFVDETVELVMVHDLCGDGRHGDAHIGIVMRLHGCAEVEIFEVAHHALPIWDGEDTVE